MIAGRWHLLHVAQLVFASAIMYLYIKTTTSLYPLLERKNNNFNLASTSQMEWSIITAYSSLVSYNLFFCCCFLTREILKGLTLGKNCV